ncbi:MAG: aconitase family protein [Candidatus Zixiibacteriota bacterium]|jgi:3-isopropylmalate/(R)-2-methylmalate dehydratase large subunit
MGNFKTARDIIEGHAVGDAGDGKRALRPDALILAGDAVLAALEGERPPIGTGGAFDADRVLFFAGDCRGGGSAASRDQAQVLAETYGFHLVHPAAGCAVTVVEERALAGPGGLVASVGLPRGEYTGDGSLLWPLASTDLPALLEDGVFEAAPPDVHRVLCRGNLGPGVLDTDVGLYVAGQFGPGGAGGAVLEFAGDVWNAGTFSRGGGVAGAAALCGPVSALYAPGTSATEYAAGYEYDFSELAPRCAAGKAGGLYQEGPVLEEAGAAVERVVIGPAAAAAELAAAARVLDGRRIHSDVSLWVSPASRREHFSALAAGSLVKLIDAGATVLPSCVLPWEDELAGDGPVAVTGFCAFAVCFRRGVDVHYVNAISAAAAALAGEICDPVPLCKKTDSE